MLFREIFRLVGIYLLGFAVLLMIPFFVAAYYEFFDNSLNPQPDTTLYFFYTILISSSLGLLGWYFGKSSETRLYRREGIAAVVLIWLITPAISALPFVLSGALTDPLQAYFEMVSGYTTTGASILQAKNFDSSGKEIPITRAVIGIHETVYTYYGNVEPVIDRATGKIVKEGVEAVSKALLFWRSFTQWLGGLGVVVLFVAILPVLGVGGKMLYQAEVPGPVKEGITPRIKETAFQLWKIYIFLTLLEIALLYWVEPWLDWLDIVAVTFSTISTGGFTIKNLNIAGYASSGIETVVMIFMVLGGLNFSLYYFALRGKIFRLKDPELILYILTLAFLGTVVSFNLIYTPQMNLSGGWMEPFSIAQAFKEGFFHLISAQTSTGFAISNYDMWPYLPQVLLFVSMFIGGMSGSTAGGIKIIRYYILYRIAQYKIEQLFRPNRVRKLQVNGREIDSGLATMVLVFFLLVMTVSVLSTIFYISEGIDPETSLGLVACFVNNIGLGFRMAGPMNSFAFLSDSGLIFASLLMILGRLEFFALFAILMPAFWKQES